MTREFSPQDGPSSGTLSPSSLPGAGGRAATHVVALFASLLLFIGLLAAAWFAHEHAANGREAAFALLAGGAFGLVLQRARFCFFCILGDAIDKRDVRPLLGLLIALAAGTIGAAGVFGAWVPDAFMTRLPPAGNIGPVGWPLALGGVLFGLGMAFSGSCVSAHLYRLGEGSLLSPIALLGTALGFGLGFASWNFFYVKGYAEAPVIWLPHSLGFAGSLILQLGLLALIAWLLWRYRHRADTAPRDIPAASLREALLVKRWPITLSGVLIGAIATFALLRTEPVGVTSALATVVRTTGNSLGWLPERLEGLDGFRGCRSTSVEGLLHLNAMFVAGLVTAAFAAALAGGHFKPKREPLRRVPSAFIGGILLGFGSMIALGCTVGRLYSGVTALSLCGWVFGLTAVAGVWAGLRLRKLWW